MDPVFHERLNYWSEAKNLDDLANRVLGVAGSPVKDEAVARRVSDVIKTFLNSNKAQLVDTDLSRLRILQVLVSELEEKPQDSDPTFATLEDTIEKTIITFVKSIDQVSTKSIEDAMSTPSVILSIKETSPENVSFFVKSVRIAERTDLFAFETMISRFFRYANDRSQQHFFSHFGKGDEDLLTRIIFVLPKDISHFSAAGCILLRDKGVELIVNRLNRLESLDFSHCPRVTDKAVDTVVRHPNMRNLKRLSFDNCILVSQEAQGKIEKMLQQK